MNILFLCTGNSCRSQMAEGWTRALHADSIHPYSAGTSPTGMDPLAVSAMAEVGVDIATQRSKHQSALAGVHFDYVITVCDAAAEACPVYPGDTRVLHRGFDDPPRLAERLPDQEDILEIYRRVRDEIRAFILDLPEMLAEQDGLKQPGG